MQRWPARSTLSAEQFDSWERSALLERIGPWMLGAFDEASAEAPLPIRLGGSAYWVWGDVGNGGIDQYFFNSAPGIECAVEALITLGRPEAASILASAIGMLPEQETIGDLRMRRTFLNNEQAAERVSELTNPFWAALREENYLDDLAIYIRDHRADFVPYFAAAT